MRRAVLVVLLLAFSLASAREKEREKSTPQEVFDAMGQNFQPDQSRGVHARYQFEISGAQGGRWWIEVNDGSYKMGRGEIQNPSLTLSASDKDWVALSNDKLSGIWASVTGRLKLRGDLALARKLDQMFP